MKNKISFLLILVLGISYFAFSQKDSSIVIQQNLKLGCRVGEIAPNISLPSPDGTIIDLYSLRGQVVLIDFWASWCGPCRSENPNLVRTYQMFSNTNFTIGNGFTIFSVSLDNQKTSWIAAIQRDNLLWKNHVSDLQGWYSPYVLMYHIQGIPSNFLVDKNGMIVAVNLRGNALQQILQTYVVQ